MPNSEEERSHMSKFKAMLLKKRTKNLLETQETGSSSDENGDPKNESLEIETKRYNGRMGMNVKDRPQIKRKKAKGPNPLSVQKKKNRQNLNSCQGRWVEPASKSNAKKVANPLNGEQIGAKKLSQFYYNSWNIKYLSKFKRNNLTDEIAYKKAIREQKLTLKISVAKR